MSLSPVPTALTAAGVQVLGGAAQGKLGRRDPRPGVAFSSWRGTGIVRQVGMIEPKLVLNTESCKKKEQDTAAAPVTAVVRQFRRPCGCQKSA